MTWQYSKDFLSYTVLSQTSQKTGYEAGWLPVIDEHPYVRSWRSNDQVTQQDLICDFGSSKAVVAVGLFNLNVSTIQLAHSADDISYTDFSGSPFTVSKFWNYYRLYVAESFTKRYVRIRVPAQTPVDNAAYFEIGSVQFLSAITTLPANPQDDSLREILEREYERDGGIPSPAGPFFLRQELQMLLEHANIAGVRTLALLGEHTPFLLFENNGKNEECYLMLREQALNFAYRGTYQEVNPRFRELV